MPNSLAYLMLMIWPVVCLVLFRRLPLERAIIWSILAGYLLLPPLAEFDLPLVPDMDKYSIPNVSVFLICVFILRKPVSLWPRSLAAKVLVLFFVLSVIPTVLTNGEPIIFRVLANAEPIMFITNQLPGLSPRDLLSVMVNQIIVLLPFFLARQYLGTDLGLREILIALVVAGMAYSVPSLVEIRLSPQINTWVYGFFQHSFAQMMRDGGFRPIVFLPHGLWLAFFMMTTVLAAAAMARASDDKERMRFLMVMAYLAFVLVLCKSLASLAYMIVFTPVVLFASPRWQMRVALAVAFVAITYPMLRNFGLIPLDAILDQALAINADRAQSLEYRFTNEELLLDHAHDKNWFGWGGWGRNLVRHAETGGIISVPDGRWIIVFGTFGWVGYIAEMGLICTPLVLLWRALRKSGGKEFSPYATPVAIILAATLADMLLNATLIPFTWLCAGALLGYAERLTLPAEENEKRPLFGETGPVIGGKRTRQGQRTVF